MFYTQKYICRIIGTYTILATIILGSLSVSYGSAYAADTPENSKLGVRIGMSESPKYINDLLQFGAKNWTLPKKHAYLIDETISILFLVDYFARDKDGRVNVTSDFEFLKPDGSIMFSDKKYSVTRGKPPESSTWGIMDPAFDIRFDETDTPGAHLLRVTLIDHVSGQTATIHEPIMLVKSSTRKELLNRVIDDPKVLDALWADYMKHKDDLAIRRIVSVLQWEKNGSGMAIALGGAARWSLSSQARNYPHVLITCEKLVVSENDTTQKILKTIIESAKAPNEPETH